MQRVAPICIFFFISTDVLSLIKLYNPYNSINFFLWRLSQKLQAYPFNSATYTNNILAMANKSVN